MRNEKIHSRDGKARKDCVSAVDGLCVLGPLICLWLMFFDFPHGRGHSEDSSPDRSPRISRVAVSEATREGSKLGFRRSEPYYVRLLLILHRFQVEEEILF